MEIEYDPAKREKTLQERGLDFHDASLLFSGRTATSPDTRKNYGEDRFITAGFIRDRLVVMVWTPRGKAKRIISMRHAHDTEERIWRQQMD
ncbi:BrnT family toxin [Komagataeibacter sp. FNDCF1]|uniref:BrnT family toxin n=1 Tax=Komagataeibacter sp. FNDCF1 TaxID=2878681 RepID=UPI001E406FF7|nr:BrnT family toxin [Komagataeibacter sp. FNDCF1]MCE2566448.1 BrnT family toxin [Komagataeibacter sp. FNDCF1]